MAVSAHSDSMLYRLLPTAWVREVLFCMVTSTFGLAVCAIAASAVSNWP